MRTWKSIFGVTTALVPIIYCGWLLYYFLGVSGSVHEAVTDGLGPTLLGLGVVGLLFCIPLIVRIVRILSGPRSPGSGGRGGPDESTRDSGSGFDADAAIARYLARQSTEATPGSLAPPPAHESGGAVRRPAFGRKVG